MNEERFSWRQRPAGVLARRSNGKNRRRDAGATKSPRQYGSWPTEWNCSREPPLEKTNVFHGVVPAVARPQFQIVDRDRCGNQGVSQFYVVALRVLPQIVSCAYSNFGIYRDAMNRRKKSFEGVLFLRASAVPELGHGDGGAQECHLTSAQFIPACKDGEVPGPGNLDQDVRVDQNRLQRAILLRRFPFRR